MNFQLNAYHKLPLKIIMIATLLFVLIGCDQETSQTHTVVLPAHITSSSSAPCDVPVPANNPVGYWPINNNSFQGVFQFLGQTNPNNATNPNISGADLEWSWAKVEPVEGQYNWSLVDNDISVWTSLHKSVILRFATGGQKSLSGAVNGSYTPSWLFDTYKVPRVTENNGTIFPVYWNALYLQKLADFVHAAAARYDSNPSVASVEIGVGLGGETEPDSKGSNNPNPLQLWQKYGYTNALWWQTIQKIVGIYEASWVHTPLSLMVTSTFLQSHDKVYSRTLVDKYTVSQGLWLQINSLSENMPMSILSGMGQFTPTIEEQGQSAIKSGYPVLRDVARGIQLGARYILVFASDVTNLANADALSLAKQQSVSSTTSTMSDCSGHNLPLTMQGRVAPVPGSSGLPGDFAQFFDGSTGFAFATRAPITNRDTWTIEASLYPTVLPQTEAIAVMNGADSTSGAGGFGLGIAAGANGGTGSKLVAYLPGVGWINSGYTFSTVRQWYHIIVTRDGNVVRFYVNGQQTPNQSTLLPHTVPPHFSIGSGYDLTSGTATHFFSGAIDEVSIYMIALNAAQVKSHQRR